MRAVTLTQNQLFKNMAAFGACVFEDRHGLGSVLLLLVRFIFRFVLPRRRRPAGGSSEAGKTRDAREHEEPENQKSCVNQYSLHDSFIRLRPIFLAVID
jgi:hypothetical protein